MASLGSVAASCRAAASSRPAKLLATVGVVLLVVPGILYAFPAAVGASDSFLVLSGSMEPLLSPGDVIFVDAVRPEDVRVGDVVTFRATLRPDAPLVTHRVIRIVEGERGLAFETQGDANDAPDAQLVQARQLVGRYDFHIPYWGLVFAFARTKAGYLVLFVLPGSIILVRELVRVYRELDKWDRERQERKKREAPP